MTTDSIYQLLTQGDVTPSAASVYHALVLRRRSSDRCAWPSINTLRQDTGFRWSERTIQRAIRRLERLGFVVRQESRLSYLDPQFGAFVRWGRQTSNIYRLTTLEERAAHVKKGEAKTAQPHAPKCHPMGDNRVTPLVVNPRGQKMRNPPYVSPPGGNTTRPPPEFRRRTRLRGPTTHPETPALLTWWRGEERIRLGREPEALPAGPVSALDRLVRSFGGVNARATLELYRAPGFDWSAWAKEAGYPLGRLTDARLVLRIMGRREFHLIRKRAETERARGAAAVLRGGPVGQVLASFLADRGASP